MSHAPDQVKVFIGSSAEGLPIARALHAELEAATGCTVNRWDTDTFAPGSLTLEALLEEATEVDFAILVATGEDTITTRGAKMAAVRDNIILEFGLFLGALGRKRVYLLSVDDAKLPSDLLGLTRLIYRTRPDNDIRAGLTDAVSRAERAMDKNGPRGREVLPKLPAGTASIPRIAQEAMASPFPQDVLATHPPSRTALAPAIAGPDKPAGSLAATNAEHMSRALVEEIELLCANATAQGWAVSKNNATLIRLRSPKGQEFTLPRRRPSKTRADLRKFVAQLRANGLRVNRALQGAVEDSPLGWR